MQFISNSIENTHHYAAQLLSYLKTNLVCLYGDLGSGKTTFVQGLAKALGIKKRIISPTFIIVREYQIMNNASCVMHNDSSSNCIERSIIHYPLSIIHYSLLIHIDCYRLSSALDAKSFNFQELWSKPKNLVVIEWAEKIKKILPKKRIDIKFSYIDEKKRRITINE